MGLQPGFFFFRQDKFLFPALDGFGLNPFADNSQALTFRNRVQDFIENRYQLRPVFTDCKTLSIQAVIKNRSDFKIGDGMFAHQI